MTSNSVEPAAFIFPLPADLKEQYLKWSQTHQQGYGTIQEGSEISGGTPVFIPVYPAYPGQMPYPPNSSAYPCGGGRKAGIPGVNPFILFLILILLVIIFKKDQIMEAIRKLMVK